MPSELINAEGVMDDGFMKDVRVTVLPVSWKAGMNRADEEPNEVRVSTVPTGTRLRRVRHSL